MSTEFFEDTYIINLIKFLALGFAVVLGTIIMIGYIRDSRYPKLDNSDYLNDTVTNIIHEGRTGLRVTFKGGQKYTLPWARNFNYSDSPDLSDLMTEGDKLVKNKYSDTLQLVHSGKNYVFVAYKSIYEK